ncbi:MAG: substrate-binding domain-containing protein, partial [Candidatus Hydrogenedentes bacterium]|nr:substrate-binding domain-containing protein [Candidatus Hydrogenedentota bacterium]
MRTTILALLILALVAGCGPAPDGNQVQPSERDEAQSAEPAEAQPAESPPPPAPAAGDIRVAFVTNNPSDFWMIAKAGTAKAAEELGCEVEFRLPADGTAQNQQQILEDLVTKGVSGIAISPSDPANQTDMLNRAAANVSLITQDSDAPDSDRLCYIGTNNYDAGVAAGELIKQALPDGGRIMLFVGMLEAQNAQDRKKGIEDVIAGSGIEVVDTRTDETDRMKAVTNVQDALVAHPDLACLV